MLIQIIEQSKADKIFCSTVVKANDKFNNKVGSHFTVACPPGCAQEIDSQVWGSYQFRDTSSICRAALFSGVYDDKWGGDVDIQIREALVMYKKSEKDMFGISTQGIRGSPQDRSFIVTNPIIDCPIDKFPKLQANNPQLSFIQEDMQVNLSSESSLIEKPTFNSSSFIQEDSAFVTLLNVLTHVAQSNSSKFEKSNKVKNMTLQEFFNLAQKKIAQRKQEDHQIITTVKEEKNKKILIGDYIRFKSQEQAKDSDSEDTDDVADDSSSSGDGDGDDSSSSSDEDIIKKPNFEPKPDTFTYDAQQYVSKIFLNEEHTFIKNVQLVKNTINLFNVMVKQMRPTTTGNKAPWKQEETIINLSNHEDKSEEHLQDITNKAIAVRSKIFQIYQNNLIKKIQLLLYEPYQEDYFFKIQDIYDIIDSPKAENGPSKWQLHQIEVKGHKNSIHQNSKIQQFNSTASMMILKHKVYFDSVINFDLLIRQKGQFGVVFRYKDPHNYCALVISEKEFKFVSYYNGVPKKISNTTNLGIIIQDQWYNAQVLIKYNQFTFKLSKEGDQPLDDQEAYDQLNIVFHGKDNTWSSGRNGFLTNGNNGLFLDNFFTKTMDCVKEPVMEVAYHPPQCNRFYENYDGRVDSRWEIIDPPNAKDGPSKWIFQTPRHGEWSTTKEDRSLKFRTLLDGLFIQDSAISSDTPFKTGTHALLKNKVCDHGVIKFQFIASDEGLVGVLFRFIKIMNQIQYQMLHIQTLKKHKYSEKYQQQKQFQQIFFYAIQCTTYQSKYTYFLIEFGDRGVIFRAHYQQNFVEELYHDGTVKFKPRQKYKIMIKFKNYKLQVYYGLKSKNYQRLFQNPFIIKGISQNGRVGLSTFGTKVHFENIRIYPSDDDIDHETETDLFDKDFYRKNSQNSDVDESFLQVSDNEPQRKKNTDYVQQEKSLVKPGRKSHNQFAIFNQCITTNTPESRQYYCKQLHPEVEELIDDCEKNFCNTCCDTENTDNFHDIRKSNCILNCEENALQSDAQPWAQSCIDAYEPNRSAYQYCQNSFQTPQEYELCAVSFCDLCCVTASEHQRISLSNQSLKFCYIACREKYLEQKNTWFLHHFDYLNET